MFESVMPQALLLAFFGMGPMELVIVGVIAVLLFGSRLPEVARSLGKSFVEFKKGIHGVESEINDAIYSTNTQVSHYDDTEEQDEPVAPKFEPPVGEPQQDTTEPHRSAGDGDVT